MVFIYPACFYKEKEGGYSVIFNDWQGMNSAATCGDTLEEAYFMAQDLLGGMITSSQDDGEEIPKPSNVEDIKLEEGSDDWEYESAFISLISVDDEHYRKTVLKPVKKTLTIPGWLNEAAEREHINFSSVLQEALKERLKL